ncbi:MULTISPECIES: hypothetical protein [unclassified Pseudomonas]|nr:MULTISPECIES: hypothetical protein [unclassified Pseudomonas]
MLVADVGEASTYKGSLDFATSLGWVRRQYSTGVRRVALHQQARLQVSALPIGERFSRMMIRIETRNDTSESG